MMASPPKPWERAGAPTTAPAPSTSSAASSSTPAASSSTSPAVPVRPASFGAAATPAQPTFPAQPSFPTTAAAAYSSPYSSYGNRFGSSYAGYGAGGYGAGGYGAGGYGGGGYGGMGYGGFGGGGMYGNSMYSGFGMNPVYGAGQPFDPNNPALSFSGALQNSTEPTFALLHSLVQTASGLSQMLESTFFATHSSFFAMVGVLDQFAALRTALGSVLGLFGLVRWLRDTLAGRRSAGGMRGEFRAFIDGKPVQGPMPQTPRPSKKPLIFFLVAIFGIPYAMHRLMKALAEKQAQGQLPGQLPPLDPSQLQFARALYPFTASNPAELALKENEIVAIVGKLDPSTGAEIDPRMEIETEWFKGRTRDGRSGWFPRKWVQTLERSGVGEAKKIEDATAPEKPGKEAL